MGCCESSVDAIGKKEEIYTPDKEYILIWDPNA